MYLFGIYLLLVQLLLDLIFRRLLNCRKKENFQLGQFAQQQVIKIILLYKKKIKYVLKKARLSKLNDK
jgi:hypothetical protein